MSLFTTDDSAKKAYPLRLEENLINKAKEIDKKIKEIDSTSKFDLKMHLEAHAKKLVEDGERELTKLMKEK